MPIKLGGCCNRDTLLRHRAAKKNNSTHVSKGLIFVFDVRVFVLSPAEVAVAARLLD